MAECLNLVGELLSVRIRVDYDGVRLSHVSALFTLDELRACLNPHRLDIVSTALEARVGTLEVQLRDTRRQLVTAMEQARAAEKKASRLGSELEAAHVLRRGAAQ